MLKNRRCVLTYVRARFCVCRVLDQVRILRALQHPNVVGIYKFFRDDPEYYYMVLEFMAGGELFDRIVQKVRLRKRPIDRLDRPLALYFLQTGEGGVQIVPGVVVVLS